MIWEFCLPTPRLFSVKSIRRVKTAALCPNPRLYDAWFAHQQARGWAPFGASESRTCLIFHKCHPPPVITSICQESRSHAIRAGYFVLPTSDDDEDRTRMTWFGGPTDVLCYSARGARYQLAHLGELPYFIVPNLTRVRNVGVESQYLFSAPLEEFNPETTWDVVQDRVLPIYAHIPRVRTLYVIRPDVPAPINPELGEQDAPMARLVPLPMSTSVVYNGEIWRWEDVLLDLLGALGSQDMMQRWQALFHDGVCFPPDISLYSLSRAT